MVCVFRRTPPGSRLSIRLLPMNTSCAPTRTFNPVMGGYVPSESLTMKSSTRPTSVPAGFSTGLRNSCVTMSRRLSRWRAGSSTLPSRPRSLIPDSLAPLFGPIIPPVFERLTCLRHDPHEQCQSGDVLNPPPTPEHAHSQPRERDRAQVCAADRLRDVGPQRWAVDNPVDTMLGAREGRH